MKKKLYIFAYEAFEPNTFAYLASTVDLSDSEYTDYALIQTQEIEIAEPSEEDLRQLFVESRKARKAKLLSENKRLLADLEKVA